MAPGPDPRPFPLNAPLWLRGVCELSITWPRCTARPALDFGVRADVTVWPGSHAVRTGMRLQGHPSHRLAVPGVSSSSPSSRCLGELWWPLRAALRGHSGLPFLLSALADSQCFCPAVPHLAAVCLDTVSSSLAPPWADVCGSLTWGMRSVSVFWATVSSGSVFPATLTVPLPPGLGERVLSCCEARNDQRGHRCDTPERVSLQR